MSNRLRIEHTYSKVNRSPRFAIAHILAGGQQSLSATSCDGHQALRVARGAAARRLDAVVGIVAFATMRGTTPAVENSNAIRNNVQTLARNIRSDFLSESNARKGSPATCYQLVPRRVLHLCMASVSAIMCALQSRQVSDRRGLIEPSDKSCIGAGSGCDEKQIVVAMVSGMYTHSPVSRRGLIR